MCFKLNLIKSSILTTQPTLEKQLVSGRSKPNLSCLLMKPLSHLEVRLKNADRLITGALSVFANLSKQ